jgi:hypothetical protein
MDTTVYSGGIAAGGVGGIGGSTLFGLAKLAFRAVAHPALTRRRFLGRALERAAAVLVVRTTQPFLPLAAPVRRV